MPACRESGGDLAWIVFILLRFFLFSVCWLAGRGRGACNAEIVVVVGCWLCWLYSIPGELSGSPYSPSQPRAQLSLRTKLKLTGGEEGLRTRETRLGLCRPHSASYLASNLYQHLSRPVFCCAGDLQSRKG